MVSAALAAALASKPVRERLARWLPIDPDSPVHSLALVLAVILFGTQASSILFPGVSTQPGSLAPLSIADLIAQEVPFVILAFAGVGLYIRRGFVDSNRRLALVRPAWWHVPLALAAAGAFIAFGRGMDVLSQWLTPDVASQVNTTTQRLYGGLNNPLGVIALGLAPGICEEILFRGALQPRLGLLVTALLFTSIHGQYGISFDLLAVLVIALGLGVIRRYTNTTTSMICHVSYNLASGLLLLLGSAFLDASVALEVGLLAVTAYAIWTLVRGRAERDAVRP
jgi:membrane protease YdiL (CAAX protease family)